MVNLRMNLTFIRKMHAFLAGIFTKTIHNKKNEKRPPIGRALEDLREGRERTTAVPKRPKTMALGARHQMTICID